MLTADVGRVNEQDATGVLENKKRLLATAIIIATAGGFRLGFAVLFPGNLRRRDALRREGRDAVRLAILAAIMLLAAGLLEGFARQLVQDLETRLIVGVPEPARDNILIANVARAAQWRAALCSGDDLATIAARDGITVKYLLNISL